MVGRLCVGERAERVVKLGCRVSGARPVGCGRGGSRVRRRLVGVVYGCEDGGCCCGWGSVLGVVGITDGLAGAGSVGMVGGACGCSRFCSGGGVCTGIGESRTTAVRDLMSCRIAVWGDCWGVGCLRGRLRKGRCSEEGWWSLSGRLDIRYVWIVAWVPWFRGPGSWSC